MGIPVVDFSVYSLEQEAVTDEQLNILMEELKTAFITIGFVYLKNTGITQDEVDRVLDISKKFFLQPDELKKPFATGHCASVPYYGWRCLENEKLNPRRPGDLKETFDVPSLHPDLKWPSSGDLTAFKEIQTSFFLRCKELSLRVLRVMALSLGLDPDVFLSAHRFVGGSGNTAFLRPLYYPPIDIDKLKENQLRCGEHSDFGTLTLLFQGPDEGLEVRRLSGEFMVAPSIPGAVLINIADLLQRWTSDRFVSVVHKVLLPPGGSSSTRQSVAFFLYPDDDTEIRCLDGSDKYLPFKAGDYIAEKFKETANV
ncbi:uncharacterized protein LOC142990864 [Genypterus blacodes]|uniref:uncharacterized protein LOC142990864 n=1 Tax=Genypterus blacodes TaxID=154954 RepID=UPI003F75AA0E